jgi:hypothetical protein
VKQKKMCRTTATDATTSQNEVSNKNNNHHIPWILRGWLYMAKAVPSFYIGGLDFGFTMASCLFLYVVKVLVIQGLLHMAHFPDVTTAEKGSTFLVPIVHSVNLIIGLSACFASHKYQPSAKLDGT